MVLYILIFMFLLACGDTKDCEPKLAYVSTNFKKTLQHINNVNIVV
jgi:hypothetical protein